jgi:hypothetical protein
VILHGTGAKGMECFFFPFSSSGNDIGAKSIARGVFSAESKARQDMNHHDHRSLCYLVTDEQAFLSGSTSEGKRVNDRSSSRWMM